MTLIRHRLGRLSLLITASVLALGLFAAPALASRAYTLNYDTNSFSVIDTATNQVVGTPVEVGAGPYSNAITPNGKFMYVENRSDKDVVVVDLQTGQVVGSPIPLTGSPSVLAISPDGTTAYVGDETNSEVDVISTQTNQQVAAPISLGGVPWGVSFAPDGKTAYVADDTNNAVEVIDTQTKQVVGAPIPVGEEPINVAFTPNGAFAYVTNEGSNDVSVIDTQTKQVVATIPVGKSPWEVAISQDGAKAYVTNYADNSVSVIDTQTKQVVGAPIPTGEEPYEVAFTPDGKTAYVTNYSGQSVTVIDAQTDQVKTTIPVEGGPWQIAIAPDQSPTASFTVSAATAGQATHFNGAASSDPDGLVSSFNWSFGDGKTATTTKAAVSHKYAKAKTFSPTLTVTDNEGCSGSLVFTGRTAYCNSGAATAAKRVKVKAPNNFKFGKLTKNAGNGTAKLKVKVPFAGKLILSGKTVRGAKLSAGKAKTLTLKILPKAALKKKLASGHSAKVKIKVKFSPTGGKPRTKGKALTLVMR
jgi:YVTN family beta-propeller protein